MRRGPTMMNLHKGIDKTFETKDLRISLTLSRQSCLCTRSAPNTDGGRADKEEQQGIHMGNGGRQS